MKMDQQSHLHAALRHVLQEAGGTVALSKIAGVTPQAVSQWSHVPLHHVPRVARSLGLPRHALRPDFYEREHA